MSYCLLWIETLLACLLFAAMLITVGLRRKTRTVRALCAVVALLPLLPLGAAVVFAGMLRFVSGLRNSGFMWAIILLACYLAGAVSMRILAGRRETTGVRRALSWPLGRIATALLVVLSLIAMTFWNLDLRTQMEIQTLRAEAGAIVLSVAPPQVPDSANAAWVYEEADRQYHAAMTAADKEVDYRDLDIPSAQVTDHLQRQHKTLATVRRATDMPQCRVDYDYGKPDVSTIMRPLSPFRADAELLALAAVAEAADGDPGLALADCSRIYALGQHTQSSPLLVSELVTLGIDAIASKTVARVLPAVTTREQLDHLAIPEPHALSRGFGRSLRGEEAFGLAQFCDMGSGKGSAGQSMPPIAGTVMWLMWVHDDIGVYREYMQRLRDIAQRPYYQTVGERKQIEEDLKPGNRRGVMSALATPALLPLISILAKAEAHRSTVAVACAATRYRLDHGNYPATAELLVPGYMESIPVDPFDGQPLRLQRMPDGQLVIYSVGPEGKDNGGDVDSKDEKHKPADVGIILKLPPAK